MSEITSIGSTQNFRIDEKKASLDAKGASSAQKDLSKEEKKQVQELKRSDNEVRAHEMAHIAAGGQYVRSGARFEYQSGPDGGRYAVGGEVSIDTSAVRGDPAATIIKMQSVKRAALAPASPSGQDRSVASSAAATEANARKELAAERTATSDELSNDSNIRISARYNSKGSPASVAPQSSSVDLIS